MKDGVEGLNKGKLKYLQSELSEKQSELKEADMNIVERGVQTLATFY